MSKINKIIGGTTTTPVPRSDWEQKDKLKADYIRNKPDFDGLESRVESLESWHEDFSEYSEEAIQSLFV